MPLELVPQAQETTVATVDAVRLKKTIAEAEGYLELGLTQHALDALQRRGSLVHCSARGCYLLGESLRELSRHREALIPLRRSATLNPGDQHVWLALGWCYKRTGQLARAIDALDRALSYAPNDPILHYNLACYWSLACERRPALNHLAEALKLDSGFLDLVEEEHDFDPLRADPGFQMLTCGAFSG